MPQVGFEPMIAVSDPKKEDTPHDALAASSYVRSDSVYTTVGPKVFRHPGIQTLFVLRYSLDRPEFRPL